ncbi:MAG: hypothetical protein NW226_19650 [Microscillaceae bacterium]|nr:hypothetical protein [Microscillaceae bacterium]
MKKLGNELFRIILLFSLAGVFSCELEEKVFIQPIPIALEASDVSATGFRAHWRSLLGATEYLLEVSLDANFAEILSGFPIPLPDTTFLVTNLEVSQTYFYRVRASRQGVLTENSEAIRVETSNLLSPVALPATEVSSIGFQANWQSTNGAIQYILELSLNENFANPNTITTTDTSHIFINLEPNQRYFYRIRATDGSSLSGLSNVIDTLTLGVGTPLPLPAIHVSPIRFRAVWSKVQGANQYEIEIAEDPNFTKLIYNLSEPIAVNDTTKEVRLYSVRVGKTHYYRVRAKSTFSTSAYSNPITVVTQTLGDCKLEEINNPDRTIPSIIFQYNNDGTLKQMDWGDATVGGFRHKIEYQNNGKISQVTLANLTPFGGNNGEFIQQIWEYKYTGDVVTEITVKEPDGVTVRETKRFTYNDSLQIVRYTQGTIFFGQFEPDTEYLYFYSNGSWTPQRASQTVGGGGIWRWTHDETLSPFVLLDPNLALLMPIITESDFVDNDIEEERRIPFLAVTNLTIVEPPDDNSFNVFGYEFDPGSALPKLRKGDDLDAETYIYSSGCGL